MTRFQKLLLLILEIKHYKEVFKKHKPEIVIHMAAQPLVKSYYDPIETIDVNVVGTSKVIYNALITDSVKAILNVTSDKCYENREWVWGYRENERMGGHDPYSCSKVVPN